MKLVKYAKCVINTMSIIYAFIVVASGWYYIGTRIAARVKDRLKKD